MTRFQDRILSFILAVIMLLSLNVIPVFAYENDMYSDAELNDYSQQVAIFRSLDIFDVNKDVQDIVTRGEFVEMLNEFFGYNEHASIIGHKGIFSDVKGDNASDIEYAVNKGYIEPEKKGIFNPDGKITLSVVVKALVRALGYTNAAETTFKDNKDPYLSTAVMLKLFDDVSIKEDKYALTYGEVLTLFKNALSVNLMLSSTTKGAERFYISEDDTVLSSIHKCTEYKGIVTATSVSDLYGGEELSEGFVRIDDKIYDYAPNTENLLGKKVRYFIKTDNLDTNLMFVCEDYKYNEELIIESDNIESYKSRVYKYYDENNRLKRITLKTGCIVVYNGRTNSSSDIAESFDMTPEDGSVRFLDNDRDGEYDVVFIDDYDTMVVGVVDTTTMTIYDVNDKATSYFLNDLNDNGKLVITTETGKNTEFKSVKENSVVSLAMSADKKYCRLVVCNTKLKGKVNAIYEDNVYLDEVVYKVNENVCSAFSVNGGDVITAYFDKNGKIANYEISVVETEVVYLINAYMPDDFDDELLMRICNSAGSVEVVKCADKVYVNNKRQNKANIFKLLKDGESQVKSTLLTIVRNEQGLVTEIYPLHTSTIDTCPEQALMKYSQLTTSSPKYISSLRSFRDYKTVFTSSCKVFIIPSDPKNANPEDFAVASPTVFENDKSYNLTTYIFGGKGILCDYVVAENSIQSSTSLYIVNSISRTVDADGEVYTSIQGYFGSTALDEICLYDDAGVDVNSVAAHAPSVSSDRYSITPGDIIHYSRKMVNGKYRVTGIQMLYDIEAKKYLGRNPQNNDPNAGGNWYMADVWIMDTGYAGMIMNGGQATIAQTPIDPTFDIMTANNYRIERVSSGRIYKYEPYRNSGRVLAGISYNNIVDYQTSDKDYSRVFIYTNAGATQLCYIVN